MGNVTAFVTWDQLLQVGIFLTSLIGLIYMIFHNHNKRK